MAVALLASVFGDLGHSILTIWNVVLGLAVMLWAFGYRQVKELLSKKGAEQAQEQPGV